MKQGQYDTYSCVLSIKPSGGDDVIHTSRLQDGSLLAVLADGATGSGHGRIAANIFLDECIKGIESFEISNEHLFSIFFSADQLIVNSRKHCDTTGIVMILNNSDYIIASVGDSEAQMISSAGIIHLTNGQSKKPRIGSNSHPPLISRGTVTGTIAIASDGLTAAMNWKDAWQIINISENDPCHVIKEAVSNKFGSNLQDDLSLILIKPSI